MADAVLPANALTTLETLKGELGIDDTDSSQDTRLARLIGVASDFIERYCGREFGKLERTEYYKGYGTPRLRLNVTPLDATADITVVIDGLALELDTDFKVEDPKIGALWRDRGWQKTAPFQRGASYATLDGMERAAFAITYTGGYVLPKDEVLLEDQVLPDTPALARTLPYDLEQVCLELIVTKQKPRDKTVKSESLLGWSASYTEDDLTESLRTMLAPYKVIV